MNPTVQTPIAIVGMSCLFPKAPDLSTFWQNIVDKVDAISDAPSDWASSDAAMDAVYTRRGGFVDDLVGFNPLEFGVMPREVEGGEPEHFIALRLAHSALADAGYLERPFPRQRTEVILGRGTYVNRGYVSVVQHTLVLEQFLRLLQQIHPEHSPEELQALRAQLRASLPPFNAETAPSLAHSVMCGRIANRLDLMGSAYTVDAACASSLIAIDLGMKDLRSGACDMVLAGGVQISTTVPIATLFCQLGALSHKGQIRPFDVEADGTLLGEGAGIVVLKRQEDAKRDGDRIYASIRSIGTASDGRALGVLAPRVEGEEMALRRAYEAESIPPHTIGLVEAHGTGTAVGDATELDTLQRVFGPSAGSFPCALGSVKSMIGHTIPAAGIAGIIKTALALYHKILPPTLHAEAAHPKLQSTRFYLNTETRPWIHAGDHPRRAAVSAFGFGGINAHAVLQESDCENTCNLHKTWDSEVFLLNAASRLELIAKAKQVRLALKSNPELSAYDLAYSLNCLDSKGLESRLAIVASSLPELDRKLAFAEGRLADSSVTRIKDRSGIYFFHDTLKVRGRMAFLFPGEGAQYPGMLADLCIHFPEVRSWFDLMDRAFVAHPRGFLPSQVVFSAPGRPSDTKLWEIDSAIEAVFTANQAMYSILHAIGLSPDAVVGHSTGEYSALLAAGVIEVESEAQLIAHVLDGNSITERALRSGKIARGSLLAVGPTRPDRIRAILQKVGNGLHLAVDNCPHQIVLCGDDQTIARVSAELWKEGAVCQLLPFSRAYHTALFSPVVDDLRQFFERLRFVAAKIPIYSCTTAAPFPYDADGCRRLAVEQWSRTVRFRETVERMYADGVRIFVEAGPRGNLTAFVGDTLREKEHLAIQSNIANRSGITQLNHCVALLAANGVALRLEPLYTFRNAQRLDAAGIFAGKKSAKPIDRSIRLSLALPALELKPDKIAPLRAQERTVHSTPVMEKVSTPRVTPLPPETFPSAGRRAEGFIVAAPPTPKRIATGQANRAVAERTKTQVMEGYMTTMEHFLETQQRVIETYLSGNSPTPPGNRGSSQRLRTSGNRGNKEGARLPLIGEVVHHEASRELIAVRTLDLQEDGFLSEHTLGPRVSENDPALTPLPIFPLAMSVEMMTEAACLLLPGSQPNSLRNVQANQWIDFRSGRIALEIHARRPTAESSEVEVKIVEKDSIKNGQPALVEAVVCFEHSASCSPRREFELRSARPSLWNPDKLYSEGERHGMFHGPLYRGVISVDRVGEDGAEATLATAPSASEHFFGSEARFLTAPLLLDAAGQVLGFWAAQQLKHSFVIFPVRAERLHFPSVDPVTYGPALCRVRVTSLDDSMVTAQIEVKSADQKVLILAEGWKARRFELPEEFYRFRLSPATNVLSVPWSSPGESTSSGFSGCRVELPSGFLEVDKGIWREVLAHLVLSREERRQWITVPENRRREWLLSRVAAKDAVRILLRQTHGLTLYPSDVEIALEEGELLATGAWAQKVGGRPHLQTTYADGIAAAVVGDRKIPGVIVAPRNERATCFAPG